MNEGQNNLNEELNTSVDTSINDIPAPTQTEVNTTPVEETPVTPIEETPRPSIDDPIPTPVEPVINTSSSIDSNNNKKGNKGLIIIVIVLLALLLGATGYIAYTNGWFGEKDTEPKSKETTDKTDSETEKDSNTVKEQVIDYSFNPDEQYTKTNGKTRIVDLEEHELGTIKIKNNEYRVTYAQIDCSDKTTVDDACKEWDDALTRISFGVGAELIGRMYTDGGIKKIAVLDDRYVLVDNGNRGDHSPMYGYNLTILDSTNSFKAVEEYSNANYGSYSIMNSDSTVSNQGEERTVGYVNQNKFVYGTCTNVTNNQNYEEYTVTVKDGKFTKEKSFTKENVFCSAQR